MSSCEVLGFYHGKLSLLVAVVWYYGGKPFPSQAPPRLSGEMPSLSEVAAAVAHVKFFLPQTVLWLSYGEFSRAEADALFPLALLQLQQFDFQNILTCLCKLS